MKFISSTLHATGRIIFSIPWFNKKRFGFVLLTNDKWFLGIFEKQ